MAKILLLDIETAPKVALVWRFYKENISPKQVLEHGHIMSFAAKWLGSDKVIYQENRKEDDSAIVAALVDLFDQADVVVAHNGDRFDFPQVMARALVHGIRPPSPYKVVDTVKVARKEFSFGSNSLEYLANVLGCTPKKAHKKYPGFELWLECLRKNEDAWKELRDYNIQDLIVLEEIYLKMLPWMRHHPNVAIFGDNDGFACPKCGSSHIQRRGYAYTNAGKYHRYQCITCGGWGRTRYTVLDKEERAALLTNAVS